MMGLQPQLATQVPGPVQQLRVRDVLLSVAGRQSGERSAEKAGLPSPYPSGGRRFAASGRAVTGTAARSQQTGDVGTHAGTAVTTVTTISASLCTYIYISYFIFIITLYILGIYNAGSE